MLNAFYNAIKNFLLLDKLLRRFAFLFLCDVAKPFCETRSLSSFFIPLLLKPALIFQIANRGPCVKNGPTSNFSVNHINKLFKVLQRPDQQTQS
jgi:hypothetical protein